MISALPHESAKSGPSRDSGFALIDALMSLVLLAVVLALLPGTLSAGKRAWRSAASQSEAAGLNDAVAAIEQRLAAVVPYFERGPDGLADLAFRGTSDRVSFVAPLPNGPSGGGLYRCTLVATAARPGPSTSLKLELSPLNQQGITHAVTMLSAVEDVEFRYYGDGGETGNSSWRNEWLNASHLPELLQIKIRSRRVPPLTERTILIELRNRTAQSGTAARSSN